MADWYFRNSQSGIKPCPGCRNLVKTNEEYCPYCARRLRPEGGARGFVKKTLAIPFVATRFLLGLMVAGFLLQILADLMLPAQYRGGGGGGGLFGLLAGHPLTYIRMGSNFHLFVAIFGEYWRLVTYCFLHFGLLHILFNGWAFWDLGRLAEKLWGPRQVFATFILTGVTGGLASFLYNFYVLGQPKNSAGASGAICGILGLLLGAFYKNRYQVGEYLGSQLVRWAVMILVFGLVVGADNAAHIGGFLGGGALGYFLPPTNHSRTLGRDMKIWNAAAGASLVLLTTSIIFALRFFLLGMDFMSRLWQSG